MSKIKIIISSFVLLGLLASIGIYTNYYKTSRMSPEQLVTTPIVESETKKVTTAASTTPITTSGSTCLNFTVDMHYGDSDSKEFKGIATLQKFLQNKGYYDKDLPINGNYATSTVEALKKYKLSLSTKVLGLSGDESKQLDGNFNNFTRYLTRLESGCKLDPSIKTIFDGVFVNFFEKIEFKDSGYQIEKNYPKSIIRNSKNCDNNIEICIERNFYFESESYFFKSQNKYGHILLISDDCYANCFSKNYFLTFDGVNFIKFPQLGATTHMMDSEIINFKDDVFTLFSNDKSLYLTVKLNSIGELETTKIWQK